MKKFRYGIIVSVLFIAVPLLQQTPYEIARRVVSPETPQTRGWEEFLTMILKEIFPQSDKGICLEPQIVEDSFRDIRHFGLTPTRPWLATLVKHTWYQLYGTPPEHSEIARASLGIYEALRRYEFIDFKNIEQPEVTYRMKKTCLHIVREIDSEWTELEQALLEDQQKDPANPEVYRTLEGFYRESIQKYPERLYYYWQLSWVFSALGEHEMRRAIFLEGAKKEMQSLPLYIKKIELARALFQRQNAVITWGSYEETNHEYLRNHALKYYLHFPEIFIPEGNPISPSAPVRFREAMFRYGERAREIIRARDTEFYAFYRDGVVNFLAYRPDTQEVAGFRMRKIVEGQWEIAIDTFYKASEGMIEELRNNHLIDLLIDRDGNPVPFDGYEDAYRIHRLPEQINEFTFFGLDYGMYEPALQEMEEKIITPLKTTLNNVGVVMIAGVSAAGKTPGAEIIRSQLLKHGINAKILSLDLYFTDRDKMPMRNGTYDYDNPRALDIKRFQNDLRRLLRGEKVELPRYDFESGKSIPHSGVYMRLNPGEVLIIEGIHALNPELTGGIKSRIGKRNIYTLRVFIDASPDLRLARRMVRDWETRGYSPYETLNQWENVRYGEDNYIYPTMEYANVIIDTTISEERFRSSPLYPQLKEALRLAQEQAERVEDISIITWMNELEEKYFGATSGFPKLGD